MRWFYCGRFLESRISLRLADCGSRSNRRRVDVLRLFVVEAVGSALLSFMAVLSATCETYLSPLELSPEN
jgi:hypothetical protein